jgi:hypothetical protein
VGGPFRVYVSLLGLVLLVACLIGLAGGRSSRPRLIDSHGRQIASVFYGANPNPKYALEFQRSMSAKAKGAPASSCSLVNGVYHPSRDNPRILKVQGAQCFSHYMSCHQRTCGSGCGGQETWCYSNADNPWYQGYSYYTEDCDCGCCTDEADCYNGS